MMLGGAHLGLSCAVHELVAASFLIPQQATVEIVQRDRSILCQQSLLDLAKMPGPPPLDAEQIILGIICLSLQQMKSCQSVARQQFRPGVLGLGEDVILRMAFLQPGG